MTNDLVFLHAKNGPTPFSFGILQENSNPHYSKKEVLKSEFRKSLAQSFNDCPIMAIKLNTVRREFIFEKTCHITFLSAVYIIA